MGHLKARVEKLEGGRGGFFGVMYMVDPGSSGDMDAALEKLGLVLKDGDILIQGVGLGDEEPQVLAGNHAPGQGPQIGDCVRRHRDRAAVFVA